MTIIGVLGLQLRAIFETRKCDEQLQPRDHFAGTLCARKWNEGYILFGTVVRYFKSTNPDVRNIFGEAVEAIREMPHAM